MPSPYAGVSLATTRALALNGAAVRITFGWACSEDVSDCDLRTLTERADAALLRRKPARSR